VRVSIQPEDHSQQGLNVEETVVNVEETAVIEPMDFFSICKILGWFNELMNEIRKGKRPQ
jgi:hypothetical protein